MVKEGSRWELWTSLKITPYSWFFNVPFINPQRINTKSHNQPRMLESLLESVIKDDQRSAVHNFSNPCHYNTFLINELGTLCLFILPLIVFFILIVQGSTAIQSSPYCIKWESLLNFTLKFFIIQLAEKHGFPVYLK